MSLDLGALVGRVLLETSVFDRNYTRVVRQFSQLGVQAEKASTGTTTLDRSLAGVGAAASDAAAGMTRAEKATVVVTAAEQKAAVAADRHAAATERVGAVMAETASMTTKEQQAALRLAAAQDRLNAVQESGVATTRQLAGAQAGLIAAEDKAAAASSRMSRAGAAMGGFVKTAAQLGIAIGVFEAIKKAIDIGKEASGFQRSMLLIQTNANASAAEVKNMSSAVLDMSVETATKPLELADALYHVEQNGLRGKAALDALRAGAEGAKIGMADVEDTTNTMTIAVASGIKGMGNLQHAMGVMIAIAGTGDMRLKDLNEALSGGILAVSKGFGVSLQDVAAVLATLGDNGIRGADAATALRQTMMGFSEIAPRGRDAILGIGLALDTLKNDMEKHGLVFAMNDLEQHMTAAGVTGGKVGGFITQAFGKKAGAGVGVLMGEIDRINVKFKEGEAGGASMAQKWADTQKTASFAFQKIGAEANVAGIKIANKLLPAATTAAAAIGTELPHAAALLGQVLAPLGQLGGTVFNGLVVGAKGAAVGVEAVGHFLSPLMPLLKMTGTAAVGMWLGFQAGRAVVFIVNAVATGVEALATKAAAAKLSVVSFWTAQGTAASAAAVETGVASAAISEEAAATSGAVVASGSAARVGWAGLAGPIGAAAVGLAVVISMFHRSSGASKEATAAAKAYSDALDSGGGKSDLVDSITKQLSDNKVPETIAKLNKALGSVRFTGTQFVDAIQSGGKPLEDLRTRLQAVVTAGTHVETTIGARGVTGRIIEISPAAKAASTALAHLNTQYGSLTKEAEKDLLDTKTFAGASASIDKVAATVRVGSKTAQQYASMLGIVADKNGIVAVSSATLTHAVQLVGHAYNTATQTGNDFLTALSNFSQTAGTAADRAALIGATLKAANGDALNFAAQMNNAAAADAQFTSDIVSAAKTAKVSTRDYLASIIDLKTGTINYSNAAAAPLISDLQSMQTAAMGAAQATFQHARATTTGKNAADQAYKVYEAQTKGQFIDSKGRLTDQARQLGLNTTEAKRLSDKYFGMPKSVKTLIEQEGANPVVAVLNQIGRQLAILTGHPWKPTVGVADHASGPLKNIHDIFNNIPTSKVIDITTNHHDVFNDVPGKPTGNAPAPRKPAKDGPHRAAGGVLPEGDATVGEQGFELARTHGGKTQIFSHQDSVRMLGYSRVPGFAAGTGGTFTFGGKQYASAAAAHNAQVSAAHSAASKASALAKLKITIDTSDVSKFLHSLTGSASSIGSAERTLVNAVTRAGGSSALAHELNSENNTLMKLAGNRATIANRIKAANTKLAAVQQQYHDEVTTVHDAVTGSFDITQAGFTGTQIQANIDKTVATAKLISTQADKLRKLGLNKNVLADLESKGNAAAPTFAALAGDSKAQIAALNASYGALDKVGTHMGTQTAESLYRGGVNAAKSIIAGLNSQDRALQRTMKHLADVMVGQFKRELKMHSPSRVGFDLGANFPNSIASGIASKHAVIRRAAQGMTTAMIPRFGGIGASSGVGGMGAAGLTIEQHIHPVPGSSDYEIGRIAAHEVEWALMTR